MATSRAERVLKEFVEEAIFRGYALVPKWKLLRCYKQEKYSRGITTDLCERASDEDEFGANATDSMLVLETFDGNILLVRKDRQWHESL